jgi:hypothetical protein
MDFWLCLYEGEATMAATLLTSQKLSQRVRLISTYKNEQKKQPCPCGKDRPDKSITTFAISIMRRYEIEI